MFPARRYIKKYMPSCKAHPQWGMEHRCILEHINKAEGTITLDGVTYPLIDSNFPTLDEHDPYALTPEEADLMERLRHSFMISERLRTHVGCLLSHGGMYEIYNSNLLFHASVPLNEDGSLREVQIGSTPVMAKAFS